MSYGYPDGCTQRDHDLAFAGPEGGYCSVCDEWLSEMSESGLCPECEADAKAEEAEGRDAE